jgi:hypothetical protein
MDGKIVEIREYCDSVPTEAVKRPFRSCLPDRAANAAWEPFSHRHIISERAAPSGAFRMMSGSRCRWLLFRSRQCIRTALFIRDFSAGRGTGLR